MANYRRSGNMKRLQKKRAVFAMLESKSMKEAAEKCGTSVRTLHRWVSEDREFQYFFEVMVVRITNSTLARMRLLKNDAINVIQEILNSDSASDSTKLKAAQFIIDRQSLTRKEMYTEWRNDRYANERLKNHRKAMEPLLDQAETEGSGNNSGKKVDKSMTEPGGPQRGAKLHQSV